MAPWMQALMGMQGIAPTADTQVTETVGNPIVAVGNRNDSPSPPQQDTGDDDPYFGNRRYLEAVDNARTENEEYRKVNPRKGMFGTKGTLRDILGVVGDAFLVQSGNKPVYMPQREEERMSDAMAGYTQDELGAIERLAAENPAFAAELKKMYDTDQYRKTQQQSLEESRRSAADKRNYDIQKDFRGYAGQMLAYPGAYENDVITPRALELITQQAVSAGIDPKSLGIREGMSREEGELMASGMTSTMNQFMMPQQDRRTIVQERNARSNETRANRAPQPRAPAQPTRAAREDAVIQKLNRGEKLNAGDQIVADRLRKEATATAPRGGSGSRLLSDPLGRGSGNQRGSRLNIRPVGQ